MSYIDLDISLKNAKYDSIENQHYRCYDSLYFKSTRKKHDSGYYIFEVYGERNDKFYKISKGSDVLDFYKTKEEMYGFSIDIPQPSIFRIFYHYGYIKIPSCYSNFLIHGVEGKIDED